MVLYPCYQLSGGGVMFYPCQYVSYLILLNDVSTTLTSPLKLAHEVIDNKRKATLDSGVYHYVFGFFSYALVYLNYKLGHPASMDTFFHILLSFQIARISLTNVNPDIKALFLCNALTHER